MGTIANAKVTHYYNCYNGDFIGCLLNTYEASRIRQKVLEGLCQRKENGISIVLSLGNIGHQISSKGLC